ncbi:transporter mch1 [Acrasis kona]|uniref:Transporter mch1 n=1 Tax=Acrasis kona TaxID=1008807 RepID=A0AAW2YRB9_9EUKA
MLTTNNSRITEIHKWLGLIFGCIMMLVAGNLIYGFSVISSEVKTLMGYDQFQSNFVGVMGNLGSALGILAGLFQDYFGPKKTCFVSCIATSTGYVLAYLSFKHIIPSTYWLVSVYLVIVAIGASASSAAVLSTNIINFDVKHRGKLVGLLTSIFALSGVFFSLFYRYVFRQDLFTYLLFVTITSGATPTLGILFLKQDESRIVKNKPEEEDKFHDPFDDFLKQEAEEEIMYLFPNQKTKKINSENVDEQPVVDATPGTEAGEVFDEPQKKIEYNYSPLQMIVSLDFWLLSNSIIIGIGSAFMILNNISSISKSYGGADGDQVWLIVAYLIGSCFGRVPSGLIGDYLKNYVSRATLLNYSVLLMGITQFAFSIANLAFFYPVIILTGIAHGAIHSIMSVFLLERFGTKFYGANSALANMGAALGNYLIGVLLASSVYKSHVNVGNNCRGAKCYQTTFVVAGGLCIFSFTLGFFLMYRNRKLSIQSKKPFSLSAGYLVGVSTSASS